MTSTPRTLTDVPPPAYYLEEEASARQWFKSHTNNFSSRAKAYVISLFPVFQWISRYNFTWALGDLIAGLTVGAVVVPQGMSYAKIATLDPQYGLYSSFIGVFLYCFFATSKDVTIGPVAVMSLETAKVIGDVMAHTDKYSAPVIATALALLCGAISLGIGLLRLGFIIEFIPAPAVAGFMTGSAINIIAGQVPSVMGTSKLFNTRDSTYKVIINTLKHLPDTKHDAIFGLISLFFLYAIRFALNWGSARYPKYRRWCFGGLVLRNALLIVFATLISWLICRNYDEQDFPISIIKTVPRGFSHVGSPFIDAELAGYIAPKLPVSVIILVLEHIAISKSFGRANDYKINPDQELIAIGASNMIGTLFQAYPATGSFSRSAIKSKSGVRTPLAGVVTGAVVVMALYALTDAFYWIPNAALAALIIHAVGDLIVSPKQALTFWKIQPLECLIFLAAVIVSIFSTIENGIYTAVGASVALLLFRIARPRGTFLGRVTLTSDDDAKYQRNVYVPLREDNTPQHPTLKVEPPPAGVLIYRLEESFTYPNASVVTDRIVDHATKYTKRGKPNLYARKGDRPWNDPGPKKGDIPFEDDMRPVLRAVCLDFSSVSHLDTTAVQALVDTRKQLSKYADRSVEFHFANILSPWIKRALIAAGFGDVVTQRIKEVASAVPQPDARTAREADEEEISQIVDVGSSSGTSYSQLGVEMKDLEKSGGVGTNEKGRGRGSVGGTSSQRTSEDGSVVIVRYPFFHIDLDDAVYAASRV
ncbi:Sulfate permease 2 [Saitoella coloradoensis]